MIAESAVHDRLWPGEQLVWHGRPRPGMHLLPGDALKIAFMVPWFGFIAFWIVMVLVSGGGPFALFGVIMFVVGAVMMGRPWLAAWRRTTDTIYVVTDRRVMSVSDRSPTFELPVEDLPVHVLRRTPGCTVVFSRDAGGAAAFAGFGRHGGLSLQALPAFVDVEDGAGLIRALDRSRGGVGSDTPPGWGAPPSPLG